MNKDPFRGVRVTSDIRLYVIFVSGALPKDVKLPYRSSEGQYEILSAMNGMLFVVYHLLGGRHINLSAILEKTFGIEATGRFYHTLQKMLESA